MVHDRHDKERRCPYDPQPFLVPKLEEPAGDQIGADDMHPARTSAADGELEQAFSAVLDQIADVLKGRKQISASLNWTDCSQDSMRITYQVRFPMSVFQ